MHFDPSICSLQITLEVAGGDATCPEQKKYTRIIDKVGYIGIYQGLIDPLKAERGHAYKLHVSYRYGEMLVDTLPFIKSACLYPYRTHQRNHKLEQRAQYRILYCMPALFLSSAG